MDLRSDETKNLLEKEIIKTKIAQQVSVEISKNIALKSKLDNILEIIELGYGLKHTLLLFPNKDKSKMIVFASRGFSVSGIGAEVPFGKGIVGMVAKKKKKLRLAGMLHYKQYVHTSANNPGTILDKNAEAKAKMEIQLPGLPYVDAQLAFPLIANDELIAVLSIESEEKNFFSVEDEIFLHALTQQMALSIQNAIVIDKLEEKVAKRTREIEKQKAELEQLNATKDRFFSIIGHDLKSPISSLKVATDLIKHYSKSGELDKLAEVGLKISTSVNNVNQLLDNLVSWAMSQRELLRCEPELIHIRKIMGQVQNIYKESIAAKSIRIENQLTENCTVYADMNMTMTVFRNVLSNAIKFSNKGGSISLESSCTGPHTKIIIMDEGVGMSPEKIDVLFTLKDKKSTLGTNREKGTGLGMTLVKDFMDSNSGSVSVKSAPNRGTSVTLCFHSQKV